MIPWSELVDNRALRAGHASISMSQGHVRLSACCEAWRADQSACTAISAGVRNGGGGTARSGISPQPEGRLVVHHLHEGGAMDREVPEVQTSAYPTRFAP